MADLEPNAARQRLEAGERKARYTRIGVWRDIIVGALFIIVALVRFMPFFNTTVPSTGLIWYAFIGAYGLYRVVRGIIKFGSDAG